MATLEKYLVAHWILTLFLGVSVVIMLCAYGEERAARVKMEATVDAQKVILTQSTQVAKDADERVKSRDLEMVKTLDALAKIQQSHPDDAAQTAEQISQYLKLQSPPNVQAAPVAGAPPSAFPAPGSVVFTPPQAEDLRQRAIGCAEDAARLSGCQKDAEDKDAKIKALESQIAALTAQRDAALKAMKGGSLLTRIKRNATHEGIGFVAGVIAGKVLLK